jgi:hypothetical protein
LFDLTSFVARTLRALKESDTFSPLRNILMLENASFALGIRNLPETAAKSLPCVVNVWKYKEAAVRKASTRAFNDSHSSFQCIEGKLSVSARYVEFHKAKCSEALVPKGSEIGQVSSDGRAWHPGLLKLKGLG